MGGSATSPLRSGGSPNKGTKSKVAHKWAEVLHHPCVLGGPPTRGQSQWWPTGGRKCYITPAFSGVPKQGDKVNCGPQVGGSAASVLRSRRSPKKGTKSKVANKWAEVLHHPCVLGGPETTGKSRRWPTDVLLWEAWPRDAALTRTGKQAGKALRSQGHHYARVMRQSVSGSLPL